MSTAWPLVGRADALSALSSSLREQRGAVIAGPAGVGRTRVAREASSLVSGSVAWFSAAHGVTSPPFAAFSRLLVGDGATVDFGAALSSLTRSGQPALIVVDDAHLLDDVSCAFVRHVLDATTIPMLLTIVADAPTPPAVTALWKDATLARVELRALGPADIDALLRAVLPGNVEPALHRWLASTSAGSPLLLRELLADGLERGSIVRAAGHWRLMETDAPVTPRLAEVIAARHGSLSDAERVALELVALAEPIGLALLERLVDAAAIETLELRNLVEADVADRRILVRLTHPVHGEVVLGGMGTIAARTRRRQLVDALEATGARREGDRVRLAILRAELGDVSDWRPLLGAAVELADALDRAVGMGASAPIGVLPGTSNLTLAARLAAAALEGGGGIEAAVVLFRIYGRLGRAQDAHELFEQLATWSPSTDDERIRLAKLKADVLLFFFGDVDSALDQLSAAESALDDPDRALNLVATRASMLAFAARGDEAAALAVTVLEHPAARRADRNIAASGLALTLCFTGRTTDALKVVEEALATAQADDEPAVVGTLVVARILALALDGRLIEAEQLAETCRTVAVAIGSNDGTAIFTAARASSSLARGDAAGTVLWADEALGWMLDIDPLNLRRMVMVTRANGLALLGDATAAAAQLEDLRTLPPRPGFFAEEVRAFAWTDVAAGRVSDARARLRDAADDALARGIRSQALPLLHDLARLGAVSDVVAEVEALAEEMDGDIAVSTARHVRALADGDPDALEHAGAAFVDIGADLWAAEAFAQAGAVHERAGRRARAAAAIARADDARSRCAGVRTPGLDVGGPAVLLTAREREVAGMAARGLTDQEIASALVLSVRTVQTHLYNAYAKLGITGRTELAAVLPT